MFGFPGERGGVLLGIGGLLGVIAGVPEGIVLGATYPPPIVPPRRYSSAPEAGMFGFPGERGGILGAAAPPPVARPQPRCSLMNPPLVQSFEHL